MLSVAGQPYWCGTPKQRLKALLTLAKRRNRCPTVEKLRAAHGMPGGDDVGWDEITETWFDEGRPTQQSVYKITPTGKIR